MRSKLEQLTKLRARLKPCRILVAGGMGYILLNAASRIAKCLYFFPEADAFWVAIPNALHILMLMIIVIFFKLPSSARKRSTVRASAKTLTTSSKDASSASESSLGGD